MRFLPLAELIEERAKIARWIDSSERSRGLLVGEDMLPAVDEQLIIDGLKHVLADLDAQITERTAGAVEPPNSKTAAE